VNGKQIVIGSLVASALGLSALVLVASPASAGSSPAARYGVINATVNAATDHEVGASTAFPNYTNGAVNNYYSLAHTHIDNSPFAEGTASPADTGPLGQTAAAGNFQQPQYADARWPGKDGRSATVGQDGGPSGKATAASYKATAISSDASASGGPNSGPSSSMKIRSPKGFNHRLHAAIAAWKARWALPLGLVGLRPNFADLPITVPSVTVPTVTVPTLPSLTTTTSTTSKTTTTSTSPSKAPPSGGFLAESLTQLDPKSRAIVTTGHSSMQTVNLGGGLIILKNVDVTVKIVNNGTAKGSAQVKVGGATVGGVPVTIDQNGVHVVGQGSGLPYKAADDAMNAALKSAGFELYTVDPQEKKSANELAITATGVHAVYTQQVSPSGVPSQSVEHIIGEVFADSLAAPGTPLPKLSLGGGGGGPSFNTGGGGSTGGSTGNSTGSSSSSSGSSSSTSGSPSSFLTALAKQPLWLLIAYLTWQSIVIATGATLWRWRTAAGGMA
jgi:hypothetical protein